jgi:NAD(P)H-flavin reductase
MSAAATPAPRRYRVVDRHPETTDTVTLTLAPEDEALAPGRAGQFHMLWVFGVGEVPISLSGLTVDDRPVHTVRAVGPVTRALCSLETGATVGVRGPFGHGWDLDSAAGHDIVIVAGGLGLAPLRPAIEQILATRDRFDRLVVLVGARSPDQLLYAAHLEQWRGRFDADVEVTVDVATPEWRGDVGVVTRLVSRDPFEPENAVAFVCGPEVMMRLAARALVDRGIAPHAIHCSLERNMHCAVGQCGHCQLGGTFVCRDGPVLPFDRLGPLLAVRER